MNQVILYSGSIGAGASAGARLIKIEIFDWDDGTNENDLIGGFQTTYSKFKEAFLQKTEFLVINPKKARRKQATYKNSGTVYLTHFKVK